ncbi:MAG: NAD+ synthase [Spirochaetes bacterium]|nr:NAD+ synthase [Spirochaetota bacterium]
MKIAVAQINPTVGDIGGNKKKILSYMLEAEKQGAELVVFPEMALIGYPPMDLLLNKKLIRDNIDALNEIAGKSKDIAVVCGYVEYDNDNPPMLYNAAAFMHCGSIISKHYKTLLPTYDVFDESRYFSPAKKQEPVKLKDKLLGITICEDIWNDEYDSAGQLVIGRKYEVDPVAILAGRKIDLMINISASPYVKGKNELKWKMISKIAEKHSLPIIYVNQVGGNDSLIFDGNSFFVNGKGEFKAVAGGFKEDLVIIDITGSNKAINPVEDGIEDIRKALVLGIKDYFSKCGFKSAVLGLSGGIDSALTAALAVQALGEDKVTGITMPSVYSSKGSVDDSLRLARNLGIRIEELAIKDIFESYNNLFSDLFKGLQRDVTEENLQARIRSNILMAFSNKFGSLLLTTGNKSELAMGYCTLYGDMAGGLAVISDLPKTMVYELAGHINREREIIPPDTITKAPSAELRENQKDQDTLPPYEILDRILESYIEKQMSADEIIAQGFDARIVKEVLATVNRSEYKRRQAAPGLKVTSKAFGTGRRLPIAQRFVP